MSENGLIELTRSYNSFEAHSIRTLLNSYEIECFIMDENHIRNGWHMSLAIGGIRIMVMKSQYLAAKEILQKYHSQENSAKETKPILPNTLFGKIKCSISTLVFFLTGLPFVLKLKNKDKTKSK
ncbi:MAG: DUF2007 domain-containing protein [Pseudomonadota bacterium]